MAVIAIGMSSSVALPSLAQDAGPAVTASRQVNRDLAPARNHFGQHILVDPTDHDTVVIVDQDLTTSAGGCPVHVSRDRGRTWTTRRAEPKAPGYGSCTRPTFGPSLDARFAPDGTLFVMAAGSETGSGRGPTDPYMARSSDLGETWEFTIIAKGSDQYEFTKRDGSKVSDVARYNRLRMAVHPSDSSKVYAGIMVSPAELPTSDVPLRSLVAASTDGGRTFGPMVDIFGTIAVEEIFGSDVPSLAVDGDGNVYAVTKERPPAPPPAATPPVAPTPAMPGVTTTTTQQGPRGAGCPPVPPNPPASPPTTQAVPETAPQLGGPGAGDRLLFAKSTDGGRTWEGRSIEETVAVCRFCLTTPEAAVDPTNGNVYVVFEASLDPPPRPRDNREIWFMRSTDGGRNFSDKVRLNDDIDRDRNPNYNQLFPGISVAPNGRVDVAWHDFRTDKLYNPDGRGYSNLAGETCWDVFYTFSTDGGGTWAESNLRISDRSMNKDEGYAVNTKYDVRGPIGIASTDDVTYIAWGDSRAGRPAAPAQDAYFSTVIHDLDLASEPTVKASSVVLGGAIGLVVAGLAVLVAAVVRRRSPTG